MDLYIVFEGILAKTKTGRGTPENLRDLRIDSENFKKVADLKPDRIVILSNQTWIYRATGIRISEGFWSKLKYVSECLREYLESQGQTPQIWGQVAKKTPWKSGAGNETDLDLVSQAVQEHPELRDTDRRIFVGRQGLSFDLEFAQGLGFNEILGWS